jgi:hypothetical protein
MRLRTGAIMAVLLAVGTYRAPAQAAEELPRMAFTISPLHLTLPMGELTGEVRALDQLGVGAVAGWGRIKDKESATTFNAIELGAQVRYYVVGDFRHGMQLGVEGIYLNLGGGKDSISATVDGFAVGPFVGYKYTASVGFTFDAQLGAERVVFHASAHDTTGASASDSTKDWIPLLNLNVGWSF